mmetsp:Transcript_11106/g.26145  ORF Transcript_11106/g.26145 Transcript_11106/m.26145 type:complete len:213 (+) Transcript_11106:886-1524(+)
MRGGQRRRASFMQLCRSSMLLMLSRSRGASGFLAKISACSCITRCMMAGLCEMKSEVHVEVMHEVCCPANSRAMSRPVTSSSVMGVPSLYLISIKIDRMSVPSEWFPLGSSLRFLITPLKSEIIFFLAALRFRWALVGRLGRNTVRGVTPWSRSWYRWLTSLKSVSLTSSPCRQREAVRMVRSDNVWSMSTSPFSPHSCLRKVRVSRSILAT